jgi:hypothetical protein
MTDDEVQLCDYAVAFIDLLGQKASMPGRHLPADPNDALQLVKNSVGEIIGTQNLFEKFYRSYKSEPRVYSSLTLQMQKELPDMAPGELRWQRFSDGLVVFIPLGDGMIQSPVNSILCMLLAAGSLCFAGLAAKSPIRAGIDVAWGVEYRPKEIYGAALACSYHLESKIAQWPRVVVGAGMIGYLHHYVESATPGAMFQFRKTIASICLGLIEKDTDGHLIVDYLGENFVRISDCAFDQATISRAQDFIKTQLLHWQTKRDEKLAARYEQVQSYFGRKLGTG